jgi:short-subunit dehydrogenase
MADTNGLAELVTQIRAQVTTIDGLVLCAGVSQRSTAVDTEPAVTERLFHINTLAPIALTRLVAPEMIARKHGLIVPVSSLAGKAGFPLRSTYSATKHALHGYFEAFRAECADNGVQITIAVPGFVATDISRNAVLGDGQTYGRMDENQENGITAEACARKIIAGIEHGALEVRTGMGLRGRLALVLHTLAPRLFARTIRAVRPT